MGEELRIGKAELELQCGQLQGQVERQQARIRGLIEQQHNKVEEERRVAEGRWRTQLESAVREAATSREESARAGREVERMSRLEPELRLVAEERERAAVRVREDLERRLGALQLEVVESSTSRATAERELVAVRLKGERETAEGRLEREGLVVEVEGLRLRLRGAEDGLVAARREQVGLVVGVTG